MCLVESMRLQKDSLSSVVYALSSLIRIIQVFDDGSIYYCQDKNNKHVRPLHAKTLRFFFGFL